MKKIIVTLLLVGFVGSAFAGHFSVVVKNTQTLGGGRTVYGTTDVPSFFYEFTCTGNCVGILQKELTMKPRQRETEAEERIQKKNPTYIKTGMNANLEGGLQYQPHNEFIMEDGRTFLMHELILKYEQILLSTTEENFAMTGRESEVIIYKIAKAANQYTIDIYTGADAEQYQDFDKKN